MNNLNAHEALFSFCKRFEETMRRRLIKTSKSIASETEIRIILEHLEYSNLWISPRPTISPKEVQIISNLRSIRNTLVDCENRTIQEAALKVIPLELLYSKAEKRVEDAYQEDEKKNISIDFALALELLCWFKNDFFTWVNTLECPYCPKSGENNSKSFQTNPNDYEKAEDPRISLVELHICNTCGNSQRFPRYSNIIILLKTRKGRCGEAAALFLLFCRAINFEARYVMDFADHVWTEIHLNAPGIQLNDYKEGGNNNNNIPRWVHADSCENLLDAPFVYALGWRKKLERVYAINYNHCANVSDRYIPAGHGIKKDDNEVGIKYFINSYCAYGLRKISSPIGRFNQLYIQACDTLELKNIRSFNVAGSINSNEYQGRSSGSESWRVQRGELSNFPQELQNKLCLVDLSKAKYIGSAKFNSKNIAILTPNTRDCIGACWLPKQINSEESFAIEFTAKISKNGADGFAFVIQGCSDEVIGTGGCGQGYAGIKSSVAIEFDTYFSASEGDKNDNHVSIQTRMNQPNMSSHQYSLASAQFPYSMADGNPFYVRVTYDYKIKELSIWTTTERNIIILSSNNYKWVQLVKANINIYNLTLTKPALKNFWIGFTAATGGLSQEHQITDISMT